MEVKSRQGIGGPRTPEGERRSSVNAVERKRAREYESKRNKLNDRSIHEAISQ